MIRFKMRQNMVGAVLLAMSLGLATAASSGAENSDQPPAVETRSPVLHIAEGFTIEPVSDPSLVQFPVMAGFDEAGRLYVAANAGVNYGADELYAKRPSFVRRLEDSDGDGRFDHAHTFADRMTFPQGALWHEGALYVASPPSMWKLEDTNGDGTADRRTELATGFLSTGNAASVHGPFLGPTGRIFWCHGRKGHDVTQNDGTPISKAKGARVWSCKLDGSDIRVFAGGGMDNPTELTFTPEGDLFGTVPLFYAGPRRDVVVHWVYGGAYAYRQDQLPVLAEFKQTGDILPHMVDLGHVAPSGIAQYRGQQFGADFEGNLFVCEFNTHRLMRIVLRREGSTYQGQAEPFVWSEDGDVHFTDVLQDADGSLLLIDTGGWFRKGCPTSKIAKPEIAGMIYRIRKLGGPTIEDPRGHSIAWQSAPIENLIQLLDDDRHAVRERATVELASRSNEPSARTLAKYVESASERGFVQAIWAAARISASQVIEQGLADSRPAVRQAALHAVRSSGSFTETLHSRLVTLLHSGTPAVRRETATALGVIGDRAAVADLLDSLVRSDNDRLLDHALVYALIEIDDSQATSSGLAHSDPRVRRGALIALDQMEHGRLTAEVVVSLLDTDDDALQQAAMKVIASRHDWGQSIAGRVSGWLAASELNQNTIRMLRGALTAFDREPQIQQSIALALAAADTPESLLVLLLESISQSSLENFPAAWSAGIRVCLKHPAAKVRHQALLTVSTLRLDDFDDDLNRLARDTVQPDELRVAALRTRIDSDPQLDHASFEFLMTQLGDQILPLQRRTAAQTLGLCRPTGKQFDRLASVAAHVSALELPALVTAFKHDGSAARGHGLVAVLASSPGIEGVDAKQLRDVFSSYPKSVQAAAEPLVQSLTADAEQQRSRLSELQAGLTGGDVKLGRAVFFGRKAGCSACHSVGTEGGRIGPALTTIGSSRTSTDLLESITFPSATIARNFEPYTVITDDGRLVSGVVSRETVDSIYLRTTEREEIRVPRKAIDDMQLSNVSIMPKGLERTLSRAELASVIAFLQSLRK